MLNRLNLVLAIALALVLVLLMLMRVDHSRPNYQVNLGDDMTYSPAYSSYEANENFASGRTMQAPVSGTIARGSQQFHFEATPADAIRAGEELVNPFDRSTEAGASSIERGKVVFQFFCVACHGADGAGNGLVAQRGFPPPPTLLTGKTLAMKDGQLLHILTFGQNSMPNFAAQLPPDRRWDVINYIRSLQAKSLEVGVKSPEASAVSEETVAENSEPPVETTPLVEIQTPTEPEPKTEAEPTTEPEPTAEPDSSAAPIEADTEPKP